MCQVTLAHLAVLLDHLFSQCCMAVTVTEIKTQYHVIILVLSR